MKRILVTLALTSIVGCGLTLPPITIVIPDSPVTNTTPPAPVEPEPPTPAPEPEPEPEPERPLTDLIIVVFDETGAGVPNAACIVRGPNTDSGTPEQRIADGSGFIHFPVRGIVEIQCRAVGYRTSEVEELPPGSHRFPLERIAPPEPPKPTPCVELECVRRVAVAHQNLLTINTRASCAEFLGHVLAALGPDWGYVGKVARESQHTPPGFIAGIRKGLDGKDYFVTGVSHDAIKRRDGQVIDVIGNAAANEPCPADVRARGECWRPGPASVDWHVVPPHDWRPENPFVPATAVPLP